MPFHFLFVFLRQITIAIQYLVFPLPILNEIIFLTRCNSVTALEAGYALHSMTFHTPSYSCVRYIQIISSYVFEQISSLVLMRISLLKFQNTVFCEKCFLTYVKLVHCIAWVNPDGSFCNLKFLLKIKNTIFNYLRYLLKHKKYLLPHRASKNSKQHMQDMFLNHIYCWCL